MADNLKAEFFSETELLGLKLMPGQQESSEVVRVRLADLIAWTVV